MQRYFPGARYLYWGLNAAGLAGAAGLTVYLSGAVPWLKDVLLCILFGLAVFLIWMILTTRLAASLARRNLRKIIDILENECDPEKYTAILQRMAAIPNKDIFKNYITLKTCTGLVHMGRYDEAEKMLASLENAPAQSMGAANRYEYIRNRSAILLRQGEYGKVEEEISQLADLHDVSRDARYKRNASYQIELYNAVMLANQGKYRDAEEALKELYDTAANELQRVTAQYRLGEAYLKAGKKEKAREAFQYAAEHGNKLHMAEEAKVKLAEI